MSVGALSHSEVTAPIIDWLISPASGDLHAEAVALAGHLDALHAPRGISHAQFHRCIELFYSRALQLSGEFRRSLRSMELPLAADWLASASLMTASLLRIAQGFERVLSNASSGAIRTQRRLNETASARALRLLCEQFVIVCQSGREPETSLWQTANRLYYLSRAEAGAAQAAGSPAETALFTYKRLLGIAALDPRTMSPGELDWAAEYVSRICGQLHVQEDRPPSLEGAWYWIDPADTAEPQACNRQMPPERQKSKLIFFATTALARRAAELLARHEGGRGGPDLEPSELFPGVVPTALLGRMRSRWHAPPKREHPRRRQQYSVEACVGLTSIWRMLRGDKSAAAELISEWDVVNESPGGYAIIQVKGAGSGLGAGMAVALRREPKEAWSVCVVRWLRSGDAGQLEMGLQIVSKGAVPVQVGFRLSNDRSVSMVDALVLPVLPALRQHQAVLAPSGTYTSRRFSLVSDIDRLYVAQGRLLSLDMQTANVELFQFEIDPYPL
ncbi:hypothetical protein VVD49_09575 [Uliginosibacterium sp. H3]|uniref:GTPase n=1 Tax=Uliginosibacterium silvisoli TaxID=3114758 RepID=A0ABU6K220_9RHOO|nr:hypothetical protein [Uliginosibacterium sp. H3]